MNLILAFAIFFVVVLYFFERRIGGSGGGSEANIVGVIWLTSAILLGVLVAAHR